MRPHPGLLGAAILLCQPLIAHAQTSPAPSQAPRAAVHIDTFISRDADKTQVMKSGVDLDWQYSGPEKYRGIRIENARFDPFGQGWESRDRIYLRLADRFGDWSAATRVGTDGETVLGSAVIHNDAAFRQEYFVERDIVETPQGLGRGIYYTYVGGALDLPFDEDNSATVLAGVQDFTGDNVRLHLRANYVHILDREKGLSAQLRTRYFHNSRPREFDYYSPRWYAQIVPVLQLRRFSHGWRYLVAGGIGVQRDADSDWRRSSYFNAEVTTPERNDWALKAAFLFSETPGASSDAYSYSQVTVGLTRVF
ncbi:MAG TPA: hypothetical protein VF138_04805 [Caulobacteraceae bacterium]